MITDPISDLIIRLKNSNAVGKPSVVVKYSKFVEGVAQILKKSGYLSSVEKRKTSTGSSELELGLVYFDKEPRIHGAERISKSSKRVYMKYGDIRTFRSGFGNIFLSTPKGVLVDMDAKRQKVGGEALFKIW
jgi:small subunit ribosomal protein S8